MVFLLLGVERCGLVLILILFIMCGEVRILVGFFR